MWTSLLAMVLVAGALRSSPLTDILRPSSAQVITALYGLSLVLLLGLAMMQTGATRLSPVPVVLVAALIVYGAVVGVIDPVREWSNLAPMALLVLVAATTYLRRWSDQGKLQSDLRTIYWTLICCLVVSVGLGALGLRWPSAPSEVCRSLSKPELLGAGGVSHGQSGDRGHTGVQGEGFGTRSSRHFGWPSLLLSGQVHVDH